MRRVAAYILCGLVVSCTEYDLGEQDGINEAGTDAQGEVSPESVVGAICGGEAETTLTLSSVGTAVQCMKLTAKTRLLRSNQGLLAG